MNYEMAESGKRIRLLRVNAGLTQQQVADMLNIDRSLYSRIEAGKYGCSVDLFIQLANLFDVSLDYLILGKYSDALFENAERALLKDNAEKLAACLKQLQSHL